MSDNKETKQAPAVEEDDREVEAHLIDRMSKLLAEIALILNGEPAPLTRPSYHDLPDKVREQLEVELLRSKEAKAIESGARDERVSMIQTLMLDWINARAGKEAKTVWNRIEEKLAALARASKAPAHADDIAVDSFARAMKDKLAQARAKGRGGWEGCNPADLSRMLREHVEKGDPRDVANYCMMLWHHSAGIAAPTPVADGGAMDDLRAIQRVLRELDPKWRERGEFGVVAREQIIAAIHYLAATQPASEPGAAVAAIRYALNADEGIEFLRCWQHGQFDVCRNEWPDAPKECYAGADPLLAMMPQPASEQQPVPQLFADTGDAVRGTFGKTVFAGMSNSDDLWPVWLDGWLRASEQQAARVLSDEQRRILLRVSECLYVAGYQMLSGELASAFSAILAAKGDGHA